MYELKTKVTDASVTAFINAVESEQRRSDARIVLDLMSEVTGLPPKMWGPSIIGFGSYHYRYASGHEGDACLIGFSPRKANMVLYIMSGFDQADALLSNLGKHKTGKACLYLNRLDQVNLDVLIELIRRSYEHLRTRAPLT